MRRPNWDAVWAVLWCLIAHLALSLVMIAALALGRSQGVPVGVLGGLELLTLGAVSHAALLVHDGGSRLKFGLLLARAGLVAPSWQVLLIGAGLGAVIKLPADACRASIERRWPTPEAELLAQAELLRHDTVGQIVMLFVAVGLVGPFIEEVFYRGVVWRLFESGAGRTAAIVGTSLCFALAHAGARDWLPLLGTALFLGMLRAASKSLWASVLAHVVFNCLALTMVVVDWDISNTAVPAIWGASAVCVLACWGLVRLAARSSGRSR